MTIEIGSKKIAFSWLTRKARLTMHVKNQIANMLSIGIHGGHFHQCFDGITDSVGWWCVIEE